MRAEGDRRIYFAIIAAGRDPFAPPRQWTERLKPDSEKPLGTGLGAFVRTSTPR